MTEKTQLEKRQADMRERWASGDQSERFEGATLLDKRWTYENFMGFVQERETCKISDSTQT